MKHDFTIQQWEEIEKFLNWVQLCNTHSDCTFKCTDLTFYKDKDNNFFASYYKSGYEGGERVGRTEIVQIKNDGKRVDHERYPLKMLDEIKFE